MRFIKVLSLVKSGVAYPQSHVRMWTSVCARHKQIFTTYTVLYGTNAIPLVGSFTSIDKSSYPLSTLPNIETRRETFFVSAYLCYAYIITTNTTALHEDKAWPFGMQIICGEQRLKSGNEIHLLWLWSKKCGDTDDRDKKASNYAISNKTRADTIVLCNKLI